MQAYPELRIIDDSECTDDEATRQHVIECMDLFLGYLRRVSEKYLVVCNTDGEIQFKTGNSEEELDIGYYLDITLNCQYFRAEMSIKYYDEHYGYNHPRYSQTLYFTVFWRKFLERVPWHPKNEKYFKERNCNSIAFRQDKRDNIRLYYPHGDPIIPHDFEADFNLIRKAAWITLSRLRKYFIANKLNNIHYDIVELMNKGALAQFSEDSKILIKDALIKSIHAPIYEALTDLEVTAKIRSSRPTRF